MDPHKRALITLVGFVALIIVLELVQDRQTDRPPAPPPADMARGGGRG